MVWWTKREFPCPSRFKQPSNVFLEDRDECWVLVAINEFDPFEDPRKLRCATRTPPNLITGKSVGTGLLIRVPHGIGFPGDDSDHAPGDRWVRDRECCGGVHLDPRQTDWNPVSGVERVAYAGGEPNHVSWVGFRVVADDCDFGGLGRLPVPDGHDRGFDDTEPFVGGSALIDVGLTDDVSLLPNNGGDQRSGELIDGFGDLRLDRLTCIVLSFDSGGDQIPSQGGGGRAGIDVLLGLGGRDEVTELFRGQIIPTFYGGSPCRSIQLLKDPE